MRKTWIWMSTYKKNLISWIKNKNKLLHEEPEQFNNENQENILITTNGESRSRAVCIDYNLTKDEFIYLNVSSVD